MGLFLRPNFFYWKSILRAIERKINLKEWLFNQISIDFRFKEVYSWPAIAAHAKFEQYDWLRNLNLCKDWNDSQSSVSTYILSIELRTERVFVNLNSIYYTGWLVFQIVERLKFSIFWIKRVTFLKLAVLASRAKTAWFQRQRKCINVYIIIYYYSCISVP